jgi:hypothetical protein
LHGGAFLARAVEVEVRSGIRRADRASEATPRSEDEEATPERPEPPAGQPPGAARSRRDAGRGYLCGVYSSHGIDGLSGVGTRRPQSSGEPRCGRGGRHAPPRFPACASRELRDRSSRAGGPVRPGAQHINQGAQGSCVAWATSYYYKTWSEKQEHAGWSLASTQGQFSPSFVYNQINGGEDYGSSFPGAFNLLQTKGDVDISEFPYNQNNYTNQPGAAQLEAARAYRIPSGWYSFFNQSSDGPFATANSIDNVKAWLASGKMLMMGIPIYDDFPGYGGNANKAYYDYNGKSAMAGGHGVCIVGYNDNINPGGADADHKGGFRMVNSWGSSWNGNGFVYLSYDFVKRYV